MTAFRWVMVLYLMLAMFGIGDTVRSIHDSKRIETAVGEYNYARDQIQERLRDFERER